MIEVNNLQKKYNQTLVLDIDKLSILDGESFGLIGNNGAGKTTFFNLLLDLISPSNGQITNGNFVVNESEEWKNFTTSFIDESFLIGYLTGEEYFQFLADLRKVSREELALFLEEYKDFFNDEILGKKKFIRDLSKGNQKKVGIIGALIGKPKVVILDEPFANLDPTTQFRLKNILKKIKEQQNTTLLVSSHDLNHTFDISDRIVCFEKGQIVKDVYTKEFSLEELENFFEEQIR